MPRHGTPKLHNLFGRFAEDHRLDIVIELVRSISLAAKVNVTALGFLQVDEFALVAFDVFLIAALADFWRNCHGRC